MYDIMISCTLYGTLQASQVVHPLGPRTPRTTVPYTNRDLRAWAGTNSSFYSLWGCVKSIDQFPRLGSCQGEGKRRKKRAMNYANFAGAMN